MHYIYRGGFYLTALALCILEFSAALPPEIKNRESHDADPLPRLETWILNAGGDTFPLLSEGGRESKQFRLISRAIGDYLGKSIATEEVAGIFINLYRSLRELPGKRPDFEASYPETSKCLKALSRLSVSKTPEGIVLNFGRDSEKISLRKNLDKAAEETVKKASSLMGREAVHAAPAMWYLWVESCLKWLDSPYNYYVYSNQLASEEAERFGKTFGPGLVPEVFGDTVLVQKVFDPALRESGLVEDSVLLAIDGESPAAGNRYLSGKWLKTDKYSYQISFRTGGAERTVRAEAVPFRHPSLAWARWKNSVYVRISRFSQDGLIELRRLFRRLERKPPEGIVVDLRGNAGGVANFGLVDCFFKPGQVIGTYREMGEGETRSLEASFEYNGYPAALLVDGRTISMSEAFAAAFKEHKRGFVIGEKTFGKGVGQGCRMIGQEGKLCLVERTYYYPGTEITWDGEGVHPDIPIHVSEKDRERIDEFLAAAVLDLEAQIAADAALAEALLILGEEKK
ncbi:MAG: hypothetical protein JW793_10935 [Acidobacteria bacterium]|nr:hypothetical protein [Acidobacteriota bacterium]